MIYTLKIDDGSHIQSVRDERLPVKATDYRHCNGSSPMEVHIDRFGSTRDMFLWLRGVRRDWFAAFLCLKSLFLRPQHVNFWTDNAENVCFTTSFYWKGITIFPIEFYLDFHLIHMPCAFSWTQRMVKWNMPGRCVNRTQSNGWWDISEYVSVTS